MSLFNLKDPFQIVRGTAPIVVGAPHHGTRPNVDADRGTGPIALALAQRLGASAVIVSDMRRTVDVNKNPLGLKQSVRRHAVRYQNELFGNQPRLVIEIHGHATGQYPIELSTGFDLEEDSEDDAAYLAHLKTLKQTLPPALAKFIGITPSVGIYPLDRDVKKTATNTYTFQKIRRARKLAGVDCYGLHIELGTEFRTTPNAQAKSFVDSLAHALAETIQTLYAGLPPANSLSRSSTGQLDDASSSRAWHSFQITPVGDQHENKNIVAVHPDELDALAALEGDSVILRNGGEEIRSVVVSSRTVKPGHIAIPPRIRRQISLGIRGRADVVVASAEGVGRTAARPSAEGSFMIGETRPARGSWVWLSPNEILDIGLLPDSPILVQGQPETPRTNSVTLAADPTLPPRTSTVSEALMDRLTLTLGDVVTLGACR